MRSYVSAVIIVLAFIEQFKVSRAEEARADDTGTQVELFENVDDVLLHRVVKMSPLPYTDLDDGMLAKPGLLALGRRGPIALRSSHLSAFDSRPNPASRLRHRFLLGGGRIRSIPNVIVHAQTAEAKAPAVAEAAAADAAEALAATAMSGSRRCSLIPADECSPEDVELMSMQRLDFKPVVANLILRTRLERSRELLAASVEVLPTDLKTVQDLYELTSEMMQTRLAIPIHSGIDIREEIQKLRIVGILEVEELLRVQDGFTSLQQVLSFCKTQNLPHMSSIAEKIKIDPVLVETFDGAFESRRLSGRKFPEIQQWQDEVERIDATIISRKQSLMKDPDFRALLSAEGGGKPQFGLINGRAVVSVPPANKNKLGPVQGASKSGKTFFVEPQELVDLTNERNEASAELRTAQRRALKQLSSVVRSTAKPLLKSIEAAAELDVARAKAALGEAWKGVVPEVKNEGRVQVTRLMNAALAVASEDYQSIGNSIDLDARNRSAHQGLLISGPNGGGKTVVMKAVGLAALLARLGVPIPAEGHARVDIFSPVLAVVGDSQSVEEKVSTFQAHCLALKGMLRHAQPDALLVCDEVGTGTDPSQGAVLAQAVIEECLDRGAMVLGTTHYSRVKDFAIADKRLAVGAMLLDDDGRPKFRLMVPGVGESHGIETARRAFDGAFDDVIQRAQSLMQEHHMGLGELLQEAEERAVSLKAAQEEITNEVKKARQDREEAEEELEKAEKKLAEARAAGMQDWNKRLKREEQVLKNLLKEAKDPDTGRASSRALELSASALVNLRSDLDAELRTLAADHEPTPVGSEPIPAGTELVPLVGPYKGQLAKCVYDGGKKLKVSMGAMNVPVQVRREDLGFPSKSMQRVFSEDDWEDMPQKTGKKSTLKELWGSEPSLAQKVIDYRQTSNR